MAHSGKLFTGEDCLKMAIIGAVVLVDAVWIALAGYTFDWPSLTKVAIYLPLLLAIAEFYRRSHPDMKFVIMTRETAWILAFSGAAATLSTLATTLNFPLIDNSLVAGDRALGFDWEFWFVQITSSGDLGTVLSIFYIMSVPLVVLVVIVLSLLNRQERTQEMVLAVMIGALIAVAISAVLPSAGALATFRPSFDNLVSPPVVDLAYKQTFFDLRAGAVTLFSLNDLKGLIAFPSYHATLSVLMILAFRGIRAFFPLFLVVNLIVLVATPVNGGHHLSDVLGGIGVAFVSFWIAAGLRNWLAGTRTPARQPALAPQPVTLSETA